MRWYITHVKHAALPNLVATLTTDAGATMAQVFGTAPRSVEIDVAARRVTVDNFPSEEFIFGTAEYLVKVEVGSDEVSEG